MPPQVTQICRYPVKGLNAEALDRVEIRAGEGLPHDRRFAIAHGSTRFSGGVPHWLPKSNFLMLARDEKLAQLAVSFEDQTGLLAIHRKGKQVIKANACEAMGRTLIGQFFAGFMASSVRGAPRFVEAPGQMFSDTEDKFISLINLESVRDLERVARRPIDPRRFRGNLLIEGLAPWEELKWIGTDLKVGTSILQVVDSIDRCAATNVDPETAERDINIPKLLQLGYGHIIMGVYARVSTEGAIAKGDAITAQS